MAGQRGYARHPIHLQQRLQRRFDAQVGDLRPRRQLVYRQAPLHRFTDRMQGLQRFQRQLEAPTGAEVAPHHTAEQAGQVGRDHRPDQHDHPAQVDPDEQDRHRRKSAVNHRIGGNIGEVERQ